MELKTDYFCNALAEYIKTARKTIKAMEHMFEDAPKKEHVLEEVTELMRTKQIPYSQAKKLWAETQECHAADMAQEEGRRKGDE